MSLYLVGDIQGCGTQLERLIADVEAQDDDAHWFFLGDLVNRGPRSLDTLRLIRSMGSRAECLLGNHDLHLLAVANGTRKHGASDTIDDILQAPDRTELLDWLRSRPLAALRDSTLLVHAGVLPQWDAEKTLALAGEVETVLQGPDWREFLREMIGNAPEQWHDDLSGVDRLRCIVNGLTRLRWCTPEGRMLLKDREVSAAPADEKMPWFAVPGRATASIDVAFGHWSARGLLLEPRLIGLDSGCVWGGKLSAVRVKDRALFQVTCPQFQSPDA